MERGTDEATQEVPENVALDPLIPWRVEQVGDAKTAFVRGEATGVYCERPIHDTFASCPVMRVLGFLCPFIAPIPISALVCRLLTPLWPRSAILRGWFMLGAPVYRPRATCLCHSLRLVYPKEASLLSPPQGSSAAAVFCREAKRTEFRVLGERTDPQKPF